MTRSGDIFGEADGAGRGDGAAGGLEHIGMGIDAGELGAFGRRLEERCDLGAALGTQAVVNLAQNREKPRRHGPNNVHS